METRRFQAASRTQGFSHSNYNIHMRFMHEEYLIWSERMQPAGHFRKKYLNNWEKTSASFDV